MNLGVVYLGYDNFSDKQSVIPICVELSRLYIIPEYNGTNLVVLTFLVKYYEALWH